MSRVIRPPDAWGQSVAACPKTGVPYLIRAVPADWGRAWAVCKLAGLTPYYVHLSDAGVVECECKAFLTDDHCKHARMVLAVLHEEGESVTPGLPPGWKDSPYKPGLPERPPQIAALPVAANGHPVPWFVAWIDGKPEFRVADGRKQALAVRERRCWVCGMGIPPGPHTFVTGPYCAVNQVTAEPPCHHQCAVYAATACPFLCKPHMARREEGMPTDSAAHPGMCDTRNPGVTVLWTSSQMALIQVHNGVLFATGGTPHKVEWYTQGRVATRDEAEAALNVSVGKLMEVAKDDETRIPGSIRDTERACENARRWLPVPAALTPEQVAQAGAK